MTCMACVYLSKMHVRMCYSGFGACILVISVYNVKYFANVIVETKQGCLKMARKSIEAHCHICIIITNMHDVMPIIYVLGILTQTATSIPT